MTRSRWVVYSTLDLGRIYINIDFGFFTRPSFEPKWNFYVGGRYAD